MSIVWVRIDDRLIHGQVLEGWLPHFKAQEVLVVSDAVAQDPLQTVLLGLAVPDAIEVKALTVREAAPYLKQHLQSVRRIFVLTPSPLEVLQMIQSGVPLEKVNVGGMHYSAGKVQLGRAIFLSTEDRNNLRQIVSSGISLDIRSVPNEKPIDTAQLLEQG